MPIDRTAAWVIGHRKSSQRSIPLRVNPLLMWGKGFSNAKPLPYAPIPAQTGDEINEEYCMLR